VFDGDIEHFDVARMHGFVYCVHEESSFFGDALGVGVILTDRAMISLLFCWGRRKQMGFTFIRE
jgi:hypothetical protein